MAHGTLRPRGAARHHLERRRAGGAGRAVGFAAPALPGRRRHAACRARRAESRRCSWCCSAWACCPRRTPASSTRSSSSRSGATSAGPRPTPPATRPASWRRKIGRTIPLIYGGGGLGGVAAMRWKQSVNENAKAPAFWNDVPGARPQRDLRVGSARRRDPPGVHPGGAAPRPRAPAARRARVATRELIEEARGRRCSRCEAEGEGRLAQLLDLVYLGDWTSYYLALDNDVDPGPIDAIMQLKAALG